MKIFASVSHLFIFACYCIELPSCSSIVIETKFYMFVLQINLDAAIIADIKFRRKFDFDSTVFDEAQRHVRLYLEFGVVTRFVQNVSTNNTLSIISPLKTCLASPKLKR